jgi:hypothetical protein
LFNADAFSLHLSGLRGQTGLLGDAVFMCLESCGGGRFRLGRFTLTFNFQCLRGRCSFLGSLDLQGRLRCTRLSSLFLEREHTGLLRLFSEPRGFLDTTPFRSGQLRLMLSTQRLSLRG